MKPFLALLCCSLAAVPALAAASESAPVENPSPIARAAAAASLRASCGWKALPAGGYLAGGADWRARFDGQGFVYEPALGRAVAQTQHLALALRSIERGGAQLLAPGSAAALRAEGNALIYDHGAIDERFEARAEGLEFSYVFEQPLPGQGELVVRLALDTSLPLASSDALAGLRFERRESGGVSIGAVLGIDAAGARARGSVALEGDELVLRLPASFVDGAQYPLVLDPLVGTAFTVSGNGNDDVQPDAAFDATNFEYLVVWQRVFSASDADIRGQRISDAGALVGSTIFFNSAGVAANPQVANINRKNRFAVVWQQSQPSGANTLSSIEIQTVDAATGAITHSIQAASVLSSATTPLLLDPDVAGEGGSDPVYLGINDDFAIVYNDENADQIRYKHLWFDPADVVHLDASQPLFSDSPQTFTSYSKPAIARSTGVYGRLLVACVRSTLLSTSNSIRGIAVNVDGAIYGPSVALSNSIYTDLDKPDVDGFDRQFVVAWEAVDGNGNTRIQVAPVALDVSLNQLAVKPTVDATTPSLFVNQIKPAVGYSSSKTWIAYRESSSLLASSSFRIKGFDSGSCVSCEGALTLDAGSFAANEWVAVATPTSGGAYYDDRGLAVWSLTGLGGDILAQLLVNNAQGGTTTDLGGGCGSGGTVGFSAAPSIGSSWFYPYLQGLPAGTLACFVNFAFNNPLPLGCGSCAWDPFQIAYAQPIQGGAVSAPVVIPCNPVLVGVPVEVQFTSVTPLAAPCPLFPGFSISNRWRMTIGQ